MVRPMENRSRQAPGSPGAGRSLGTYGLLTLTAVLLAGCGVGSERISPLEMKVRDLEREKVELNGQLEQCRVETEQVKAQVNALAALPQDKKENRFYALSAVKIARFTDFYDKDNDGKREKLIVYVQPVDQVGDAVKTAGVVSVQLWNLGNPGGQALLGQWQISADELHKLWFNSFVSTSFRLTFDAPVTPAILAQPLTAKMTFTDYLTGQVFTDQYVIPPKTEP
jgi:hypothetical protein